MNTTRRIRAALSGAAGVLTLLLLASEVCAQPLLADRVRETTTTTGTGTIDLAGAVTGYQSFVAGIGTGNVTYYGIVHRTANEWEIGSGTVTDAATDTLSRTTVLSSTNGGAAVNFSAGTKDVFVTVPAGVSTIHSSGVLTANRLLLGAGGADLAPLGSLGTTTTLLHGNAAGAPTFGAVVSADLNITGTTCTNQFVTALSSAAAGTCTTATLASAQFANQGTTTTVLHGNAGGNPSFGAVVSNDLNITTTSCTNQFVTAISSGGVGTCTSATLASAQYANQGTTTTVLHGNAAGNPSFGGIAIADLTATGTPGATTYLRGDNTWSTPSGAAAYTQLSGGVTPTAQTAGSTVYYPVVGNWATTLQTTDASGVTRNVISRNCTLQNFYVIGSTANGVGKTNTFTVFYDGATSGITCSMTNATTCNDTTHTQAAVAGHEVGIQIITAAASSTSKYTWGVECAY